MVVVPAAARSVITAVNKTTFRVGGYNSVTDTFSSVVDLNDRVSYWLVSADLQQPKKVYSRASTIRAQGERIANWNYQNRHIKLVVNLLYGAGTAALLASIEALLQAIENPPYRIAFAAPNSTVLTYADVVAVTHSIPYDGKLILNGAVKKITIDFECLPGLPGDRINLSNLVSNPGFEAPSGPALTVFNDGFANSQAYTGAGLTVAANVMTIPTGVRAVFGSPAWGAINTWQVRFQASTNLSVFFTLHVGAGGTLLRFQVTLGALIAQQFDGVTNHTLASSAPTLTNGTWYWIKMTQFPALPGVAPLVQATLYADSAGAIGAAVTNGAVGPTATFDATSGVSGQMAIETQTTFAAVNVGGAFSAVHVVQLFGPGGWIFSDVGGTATAISSGAWEQNSANLTYSGGPGASYGAARLDLPPTGTVDAFWTTYTGGAPAGNLSAMPIHAAGDTLAAAVVVRSSGLASTTIQRLNLQEWDNTGAFLRGTVLQSVTGNQAAWTKLSGSVVTGASAAYAALVVEVIETTSGASANGTVWFDNAQVWNQTTTGQTVMPYCELRFPQNPAQLIVGDLQGDMPAPALISMGYYISGSAAVKGVWRIGSRATVNPTSQLVYQALPLPGGSPALTQALSSAAYGGAIVERVSASASLPVDASLTSMTDRSLVGAYHVFGHFLPYDTTYANQTSTFTVTEQTSESMAPGATTQLGQISTFPNNAKPVGAAGATPVWTWTDNGLASIPIAPPLLTEQLTAKHNEINVTANESGSTGIWQGDAIALMPADGDLLAVYLTLASASGWFWLYSAPDSPYSPSPAIRYSQLGTGLPNPYIAGGGAGANGTIGGINLVGASYLRLDPTQANVGLDSGQIGQFVSLFADTAYGNNNALAHELSYAPQYLYPRSQ